MSRLTVYIYNLKRPEIDIFIRGGATTIIIIIIILIIIIIIMVSIIITVVRMSVWE